MSRSEEYLALLEQLHEMPPALEYTAQRATAKARRRRRTVRFIGIPVGTLLGCLTGFVLMVNLVPAFAYACGRVDGLRELAKAVAWSPSLSAAVENEYVQPIEQAQKENGFTVTVQYVIVDQKRLNVFYTMEYDKVFETRVSVLLDLGDAEEKTLSSVSMGDYREKIRSFTVDFKDQVPEKLDLTLSIYVREENGQRISCAEMPFRLELDPYFTAQGEVLSVGKEFALNDQRFTLTQAEIYPTHARIRLEADRDNTLILGGAELYLENERGERFEPARNGVVMELDEDGGGVTFVLDSTFFSRSEQLTLYITEVRWKDWVPGRVRVDLAEGTTENLPEGIRFLGSQKREDGWYLWFTARTAPTEPAPENFGLRGIFINDYWDSRGNHYMSMGRTIYNGLYDPNSGEHTMKNTGRVTELVVLPDYTDTAVWLEPARQKLEEPASIAIKE